MSERLACQATMSDDEQHICAWTDSPWGILCFLHFDPRTRAACSRCSPCWPDDAGILTPRRAHPMAQVEL